MSRRFLTPAWQTELALAGMLFGLALVVRAVNLYTIPRLTDEVVEWSFAFDIAQGQRDVWHGVQPYFGPLVPDLLALALLIFRSPLVPRALVCVLGALTAPAVYALGRAIGGRRVGIIAGLLMATSSTHIIVASHIAYTNSLTPLLTALMLTLFVLARKRNSGRLLVVAGFVGGLAAQTHPVVLGLAPGMLLWFFGPRAQWRWFRRPAVYCAAGVALLAYSPVLVGIVLALPQFQQSVVTRSYAFAPASSLPDYAGRMQGLLIELARMVGAVYPNLDLPRRYLIQPLVAVYALLALLALWAGLRGSRFLLLVTTSGILLIPLFNRQYGDFPFFTRYIALLLPPVYAAAAVGLVHLWTVRARHAAAPTAVWAIRAVGALAVLGIAGYPLWLTADYYASQVRGGRTNTLFLEMIHQTETGRNAVVWLDDGLGAGEFASGGNLLVSFQVWLTLEGRDWRGVALNAPRDTRCPQHTTWLIAADDAASRFTARCGAVRVNGATIVTRPGRPELTFSLYHVPASP